MISDDIITIAYLYNVKNIDRIIAKVYLNARLLSHYEPIPWNVKSWLYENGFNYPMTEEQEVEFKLRYL